MNEKIQEIANQAKKDNWQMKNYVNEEINIEKFAELLIREFAYDCMNVTSSSEHINLVAKKWGVEL